ncbi:zinc-dependent alcohol dehydrogenase [Natranaeroarchaeum sulfidigenes]|uniref:Threonine dehydrogenase or related Zn-dependent dehydrogenase n=1 Tax=Natranaeroarchaeum sulfidigenes TaxID=2784880 RepID=A0A897MSU5_9EURY|nr:Threonine dehydrogenase or related Zn-dependent dehydrogenase [Natranaeroarchaeum sulfidigenes]
MNASALYFTDERTVETRSIEIDGPASDELLIETEFSAVSAGTELLVYRNETPPETAVDETIESLRGEFSYPMQYGYAAVGEVVDRGRDVEGDWVGKRVFAFNPHQTRFSARPDDVIEVPEELSAEHATLLPTVETATNLTLDVHPRLGEQVVVFGAGVIGLCTVRLLSEFPLDRLVAVDPIESRRALAVELGADTGCHPEHLGEHAGEVDVAVELSGQPDALDDAIGVVSYDGRVVVGSWYGTKRARIDFGSRFHRNRIELVSSQVSTIDPELRGRWDTDRRMDTALEWLGRMDAGSLVSHQIPFEEAGRAYELLDEREESAVQVVLTY